MHRKAGGRAGRDELAALRVAVQQRDCGAAGQVCEQPLPLLLAAAGSLHVTALGKAPSAAPRAPGMLQDGPPVHQHCSIKSPHLFKRTTQ